MQHCLVLRCAELQVQQLDNTICTWQNGCLFKLSCWVYSLPLEVVHVYCWSKLQKSITVYIKLLHDPLFSYLPSIFILMLSFGRILTINPSVMKCYLNLAIIFPLLVPQGNYKKIHLFPMTHKQNSSIH